MYFYTKGQIYLTKMKNNYILWDTLLSLVEQLRSTFLLKIKQSSTLTTLHFIDALTSTYSVVFAVEKFPWFAARLCCNRTLTIQLAYLTRIKIFLAGALRADIY